MFGRYAGKRVQSPGKLDFSKWMIKDIRPLLWIVTLGGFALAFYSIRTGYMGSLPWISAMVGLPWTAHGVICSFYLNLAKSDHSAGGITFETAKANNFGADYVDTIVTTVEEEVVLDSPAI